MSGSADLPVSKSAEKDRVAAVNDTGVEKAVEVLAEQLWRDLDSVGTWESLSGEVKQRWRNSAGRYLAAIQPFLTQPSACPCACIIQSAAETEGYVCEECGQAWTLEAWRSRRAAVEREELTMIALALKNEGIEDCTPEEGVEQLVTLLASLANQPEKNSGGVEEGTVGERLREAVTRLQAAMYLTGSPPKDQAEALAALASAVDALGTKCEACNGSGAIDGGGFDGNCPDCHGGGFTLPASTQPQLSDERKLALLRDKGATCNDLNKLQVEEGGVKDSGESVSSGVAIEGDPGQRFCVFYPDGRMCGEPAVETLILPGGKGELDICASHLGDLVNHHCLRPHGPTQQSSTGKEDCER